MSFFSKIFGAGDPIASIRKYSQQRQWSDVISSAISLDESLLSQDDRLELKHLVENASSNLSLINFDEAVVCINDGDFRRGLEHIELARKFANNDGIIIKIEELLGTINTSRYFTESSLSLPVGDTCSSSCCEKKLDIIEHDQNELDENIRIELILTAYPQIYHESYRSLSQQMRQGILLAHEGLDEEAHIVFSKIPDIDRSDVFCFEYGSVLARIGRYHEAVVLLHEALSKNTSHALAAVTLVELHLANQAFEAAVQIINSMLAAACMPDYCYGRMFYIAKVQGDERKAFEFAKEAIRFGCRDPELIVFASRMFEHEGNLNEAEQLLSLILTGGGCSGGVNVDLAEFWLRNSKHLSQALEIFKKAAKNDFGNPLWTFNIARTYLSLGWKREAFSILEALASSEIVSTDIRLGATQLLRHASEGS